jgi:uncharacterized cupredoxin-like copper-binding protein
MRKTLTIASLLILSASTAWASGSGDHTHELAIGVPGDAAKVERTITIAMKETGSGKMLFSPANFTVSAGETVRLKFTNGGETDHEFVMDTVEAILEHKKLMEQFPEMEHADPNAIRLQPNGKGEIIWTFGKAGEYAFGCLIPGHYEAGMKGTFKITK